MLVNFQSVWFKAYCDAILASEPEVAERRIEYALESIHDRLLADDLSRDEREAMGAAIRYLMLIRETELPKAS